MEQYTEKELIVQLRNLGCTDEFRYDKGRSSLRGHGHEKFVTSVEQYYAHVSIEGTGAKRIYTVDGEYATVQARQSNNKGSSLSTEDTIMHQYIFQRLQELSEIIDVETSMSMNQWCKTIGFRSFEEEKNDHLKEAIKSIHTGHGMAYNPNQIIQNFFNSVRVRNVEVFKLAIKKLEETNKITLTEKYMFKNLDEQFEEMSKTLFDNIKEREIDLAGQHGMNSKTYFLLKGQKYISGKNNRLIINNIRRLLSDEFGISYTFKTYQIDVLDKEVHTEISIEEFLQAYTDRMVKLALDRKNQKVKDSQQKLFYTVNTLYLLSLTGFNVNQNLVEDELETIPHLYKKYNKLSNEKSAQYNSGDRLIKDMEQSEILEKMLPKK